MRHGHASHSCGSLDVAGTCLSSANLTEYAFSINMELGVLITGGALPGRVERHFDSIIQDGRLLKL